MAQPILHHRAQQQAAEQTHKDPSGKRFEYCHCTFQFGIVPDAQLSSLFALGRDSETCYSKIQ
ncbi:MAG: hypothetical protein WStaPseu_17500 [Shewanella algae]